MIENKLLFIYRYLENTKNDLTILFKILMPFLATLPHVFNFKSTIFNFESFVMK